MIFCFFKKRNNNKRVPVRCLNLDTCRYKQMCLPVAKFRSTTSKYIYSLSTINTLYACQVRPYFEVPVLQSISKFFFFFKVKNQRTSKYSPSTHSWHPLRAYHTSLNLPKHLLRKFVNSLYGDQQKHMRSKSKHNSGFRIRVQQRNHTVYL